MTHYGTTATTTSRLRTSRLRTGLLALAASVAVATGSIALPAEAATTTPDSGGYRLVDSTEPYGPAGGPFTSIATTGQDAGNHCDDCVTPIQLPFAVDLYDDEDITTLNASSNGDLQVHSASTWPGVQQPNSYLDGAIIPFHADLRTDRPGGGIFTQTIGTGPHRQFVVEWVARDTNDLYSADFQVVLTEGSREIQFRYLAMDAPGQGHSTGIQGGDGSDGKVTTYSDFGRRISSGLAISFRRTTTAVSLTTAPAVAVTGQKVALTAHVTPTEGTAPAPTGSVMFTEGASVLGTVAVDSRGNAVLRTAALNVGYHYLVATHLGSTGGSSHETFVQVRPAGTATTLRVPSTTTYGSAIAVSTKVVAPGAGTATGRVHWWDDDHEIALTPLTKGSATLPGAALAPGEHHLQAVLENLDGRYVGSRSDVSTITVARARATTSLVASPNPVTHGKTIRLTATVRGASGAAVPTGVVTFTDGDVVIGTAAVDAAGRATLTWTASTAGTHLLRSDYSGDERYDGAAGVPVQVTVQ